MNSWMKTASETLKLVSNFVDKKKSFTAFDVTNKLRKSGMTVYHSQIKEFVHSVMKMNLFKDYLRTTHAFLVKNNYTTAEVYHHKSNHVTNYVPIDVLKATEDVLKSHDKFANKQNKNNHAAVTMGADGKPVIKSLNKSLQPTIKYPKHPYHIKIKRDGRGRLCIPNRFIRKIGGSYKTKLYVSKGVLGSLRISATRPNMLSKKYMVDKDCNLRIPGTTLKKMGPNTDSSLFTVVDHGDEIYIYIN